MKAARPSTSKTLVFIRFSALGDVALTIPVLLAFTAAYPNHRIIVCTRPGFAPIFDQIPNIEVLPAALEEENKGVPGLFRLYRRIAEIKPDHILDAHNVLRTKILRLLNGFKAIPYHVLDKARVEKRELTREERKIWHPLPHTTDRYANLFKTAGFPLSLSDQHVLAKRTIRNSSLRNELQGKILIGIAPFAAHSAKMYDLELLEKVVAWLSSRQNCRVLLFGGGLKEQNRVQIWEEKYSNCINLIGRYAFEEELDVISQLNLMLTMDSANGHLSAIFGVPTLTLWGVTHPYAGFGPFGQPEANSLLADRSRYPAIPTSIYGNQYPPGYENAINTIPVIEIQDRIKEILSWD